MLSCFCESYAEPRFSRLDLHSCPYLVLNNINGNLWCNVESNLFEEKHWVPFKGCPKPPNGSFRISCPHCEQNGCN